MEQGSSGLRAHEGGEEPVTHAMIVLDLDSIVRELRDALETPTGPPSFPCPVCGGDVPWEARLCIGCGTGFIDKEGLCPYCDTAIGSEATSCSCGAELAR